MILSDERFAAALLVREGGAITPLLFDDIGDMLDYERSHGDMDLVDRFVHDADSRAWLPGSEAAYVRSETLHTPMGSGLAAFADPAAAQARARELGGAVLTFQEAARVRREWVQDRNLEQRPAR
jgi:copper chaperone NosL